MKKLRKLKVALAVSIAALVACCALVLAGCAGGTQVSSSSASSEAGSTASASASASAASASASTAASASASASTGANAADSEYGSGIHHARLTVEGYDPIDIELDADAAPLTVANFCELANEGYYDGLNFYRIVEGFCLQGGTKGNSAKGRDSSLKSIPGEFSANGYDNPLADDFKKGTVAMARSNNPNSATSTFFVTLDTSQRVSKSLNGLYAAFGTIDEAGMAIVDQIVADYLPNVTDSRMGIIADEADQAKIVSLQIID